MVYPTIITSMKDIFDCSHIIQWCFEALNTRCNGISDKSYLYIFANELRIASAIPQQGVLGSCMTSHFYLFYLSFCMWGLSWLLVHSKGTPHYKVAWHIVHTSMNSVLSEPLWIEWQFTCFVATRIKQRSINIVTWQHCWGLFFSYFLMYMHIVLRVSL